MTATQSLTYENIINQFLDASPEIRALARERDEWWHDEDNDPLTYVFVGDVVNEFTAKELTRTAQSLVLVRLFAFFEMMATSKEKELQDLLQVGTLEVLGDDKTVLARARALMGPKTLALSHEIERIWGRESGPIGEEW